MKKLAGGKNGVLIIGGILAIGVVACATPMTGFTAENTPTKWRVGVGLSYRGSMNTEIKGESRARSSFVETMQPAKSIPSRTKGEIDFSNSDDITQVGDRNFDDGFVHTDVQTASDGMTVNFGYQVNSQNDSNAGILTFHRENDESGSMFIRKGTEYRKTVRTDVDEEVDAGESFGGGGLKVDALYSLVPRGGVKMALTIGLRGFFGMDSTVRDSNFHQTINENWVSYRDNYIYSGTTNDTYTFQHGGIPPAPYSNPDGDPEVDPLIMNIPSSATRDINVTGTIMRDYNYRGRQMTSWEASNQIEIDTDVDLFQLAMGGEFAYEIGTAVSFSLRPLLLVNLINVDATRNEDLVAHYPGGEMMLLGSWYDKKSNSTVRLGAAIEAGVNVRLSESWFAGLSAGYEWIDDTSVTVGPNTINIDLSGFTTSFIVGVRF